jgi:ABC-type amino acid transport substrate-binding protein
VVIASVALLSASLAQAATIGVPENLPPFGLEAANPEGQRGIYADLADAIAAHTHVPIELKFMPYGRMLQELKTGEVDYAFGVVSPAIAEAGPFIAVVSKVPMVAAARKGLSLTKLDDLHNFAEVGYLRGGSCGSGVMPRYTGSARTTTTAPSTSSPRAVLMAGAA